MYVNKAFIYGNLTRDPQLKSLPSGTQVVEIGVATNRTWKNKEGSKQESTEFHNCVAFGKQAELISQYLHKGNAIFVEGRLQTRSWDAQDGSKKYRTEIIVENFQFGPKGVSQPHEATPQKSEKNSEDKSENPIEYPEEEPK